MDRVCYTIPMKTLYGYRSGSQYYIVEDEKYLLFDSCDDAARYAADRNKRLHTIY